jgi:peptidoglycan L-alanyl-D-glutamate endopeptidase CwlK
MPKFDPESFSRLSICHPDLQSVFYEVIKTQDCEVLTDGRNQTLPTYVNVAPKTRKWGHFKDFYLFAGYVLGIAQKLKEEGKISHSVKYERDLVRFEISE